MLIILLFSNALNKPYNLLAGPDIKGEIILFTILFYTLLKIKKTKFIYTLFILSPIILSCIFLYEGHRGIVWSDDNPTFIYRLEALKKFFPNIPFYYTGWNSGLDARDFFATGALNIFFLAYPIIKFLDVPSNYNIIIAYLLFIIPPLCTILACKILKKDFKFISIATLLTITNSLVWYRWTLKYGTLGFITSASLSPLVFVLTQKFLSKDEKLTNGEAILLVLSTTLLLFWSAAGLVFIPCIIYGLFFIKRIFRKKYTIKIILSLLLINIPWIVIFWSASNVGSFIKVEKETKKIENVALDKMPNKASSSTLSNNTLSNKEKLVKAKVNNITLERVLKNFRETFISINPLIYLFTIPSIFLLNGTYRVLYILTSLWLLFLGTAVSELKPQMEFNRMLIILTLLSVIPATKSICNILKNNSTNLLVKISKALILSVLFVGIFSTGSIFKNRTLENYHHKNENVDNLITFLKDYKTTGRVLFVGFVLHEYGEGHIAPTPFLTGKQMIASSPFHNIWKYTEVIPIEFLSKNYNYNLIKQYLDLQNVELLVAHERKWKEFLSNNENFEEVYAFYNYKVYRYKNYVNSYLISGNLIDLKIYDNKLVFTPLTKEVVLKFNYFPFLQTNNCKITEFKPSRSIKFIKLYDCNINKETTLEAKNAFLRVLNN
ncbi:MAG: hypothetical protein ACOX3T_07050 [Bdellovibrionota bacterium]